jgi:hypothetical protein
VDCLVTFALADPYRFVYNIEAEADVEALRLAASKSACGATPPDAAAAAGAPGADESEERRPNGTPPPATDLARPDAAPARAP